MKITFKQSGGFAAALPAKSCDLDTATLGADDARRLRALAEDSGFLGMDGAQWKSRQGGDLQTYDITIHTDRGPKHFSFDDMTVPEEVYPLLEFLQDRCD